MNRFLAYFFQCLYLFYLTLATILFHLFAFPFILLLFMTLNKGRMDDAVRFSIHLYGSFVVRISWPLVRIRCIGRENIPVAAPCIVVVNHRSTPDMFFAPFFTPKNTVVFVRSWPFRLWFFGWFMRRAGYIDIEKMGLNEFIEGKGRELYERGLSFLFFPEGHRSRSGKLQPFRSGAFLTAVEFNIPVVPVCITGTEKFLPINDPLVRPAKINIEILPPVHPSTFPVERRSVKLKKHVESLIREHLNE